MEYYVAALLGMAVGLCFDILVIPMGIAIGMLTKRWWQCLPFSVAAGVVHRAIVFAVDDVGGLGPFVGQTLIATVLAIMVWSTIIYLLNRRRRTARMGLAK